MTTQDPFDLPTPPATCRRCRAAVLRVRDTELGVHVDLNPQQVPITGPLPTGRVLFEHHPHAGWHHPSSPRRRGYPLHTLHDCQHQTESEHKP